MGIAMLSWTAGKAEDGSGYREEWLQEDEDGVTGGSCQVPGGWSATGGSCQEDGATGEKL